MYEDICYGKSFLKQVIARIDFASPVEQLEKSVPIKLVNVIVKDFPIVEPSEVLKQELEFDPSGVKHKQTAEKTWNYFGKNRERHLQLTASNMFVTYDVYTKYEEVKEQFGVAVEAFGKAFPGTMASRFGLRYVNQIDLPLANPTDWREYISHELLQSRSFFSDDAITRLISIAELKYDDMGVRFQFGMPNQDYPAEIKRPLFVLDIDASVSQAHDLEDALGYMEDGHARIQNIFERSITPKLREMMNVRPVQE
jgi:uncharacterized protein (TIGR04255 family)